MNHPSTLNPYVQALVLNIGLAADAHILTFERCREELHALPQEGPKDAVISALKRGQILAMVTIMEASITTTLAMVVLYSVGVGPVQDFAYITLISVGGGGMGGVGGWGYGGRARSAPLGAERGGVGLPPAAHRMDETSRSECHTATPACNLRPLFLAVTP